MKRIYALLFVLSPLVVLAQDWTTINVGTNQNLNNIYFKNESVGFIIGDNGTLLKTVDGGINWATVSTGATNNLYTISFLNDSIGYINGLKTTDGGNTWFIQASSQDFGLIYAQDTDNLIAGLGDNVGGDIYRSQDGGNSWTVISNPIFPFNGVYDDASFVNDTVGYLSAWYSDHLVKTIDGGNNWDEIIIDTVDGSNFITDDFRSVYFFSENIGLVTHQNGFLKTADAGQTWSEIKPVTYNPSFYPRSIIANTANNYIAVGNALSTGALEKIYETNDGGVSWTLSNNTVQDLHEVACAGNKCFAVGSNGTVFTKANEALGLSTSNDELQISIHPNPTTGDLYINSSVINTDEIEVFDMMGRQFRLTHSDENKIDTSTLPSGAYLLRIVYNNKIGIIKFIKN